MQHQLSNSTRYKQPASSLHAVYVLNFYKLTESYMLQRVKLVLFVFDDKISILELVQGMNNIFMSVFGVRRK